MKREIICLECGIEWQDKYPFGMPFPDEYQILKKGNVKLSGICDHCNKDISGGTTAFALSTWNKYQQYIEWEDDYFDNLETRVDNGKEAEGKNNQ